MALYSFSAQYVGRSHSLKNCVSAAAYRAGERLLDERSGLTHDYADKRVELSEILAPEGAPAWVFDRHKLWNTCEQSRNRVYGITARELRIALPRELNRAQQVELVRGFLREEFVALGMVADWSLHDEPDKNQPHVHVMLTTRELTPEGFGNQVRAWDQKKALYRWREQWAEHANHSLERAGHEERIDHRSYKTRGIDLEPQPKLYRHPDHVAGDGRARVAEQLEDFLETARRNGQRIIEDPTIPIRLLTQQRATFRREDLLKVLHTHSVDAEQFSHCLHAVMACPELVELPTGRYTSQEMLAAERQLLASADALAQSQVHLVAERHVRTAVERAEELLARQVAGSGQPPPKVSDEQRRAITHLTASSGSIALLEGHAGTGKSFLLGAAREAWEAQGLTVIGGALAGKAAEGLQLSSGISSRTLASWERSWSLERDELTAKHVLVIDEAGMLGTRQLGRVLEAAREAGAKVVLVGDSRQLQAIEAGSPFRVLGERIGTETLAEVRRQRVDWQREATMAFADKRPKEALAAYRAHGNVRVSLTTEQTRAAVVAAWAKGLESTPLHEQMMYAYRRDDVRALNELAREVRRAAGALGEEDHKVTSELGERVFAQGDRVYFTRNDRQLDVKNGTLGTIEQLDGQVMTVRVDGDDKRLVQVDLRAYAHLDHGYAATVHKSQGATVDRAYVMASKLFDASTAYVALSRHRDHVELHWARDEFGTRAELERVLCRERPKELALEQFAERSFTLKEVLKDESRFALLAPDMQRSLIAKYDRAYEELREKKPFLSFQEELAKHPQVIEAKEREERATQAYSKAGRTLLDYREQARNLPWYRTMSKPESVFLEAEQRAKDEYWSAKRAREELEQSSALREELSARIGAHNVPMFKHQERIKQWRAQVLAVERAGAREHALGQLAKKMGHPVRWAREADTSVKFEVVETTKVEVQLGDLREIHVAVLKAPDGKSVLKEIEAYERHSLKQGMTVELEQGARGLSLSAGRGLGWSR